MPTTDSRRSSTPDDVRVNLPAERICNIQSGVDLARSGDTVVTVWNDSSGLNSALGECDRRDLGQQVSLSGYGYSFDGGGSWTDGGLLTPPPNKHLFGDPVVAAGPGGRFYFATLMRSSAQRGSTNVQQDIVVARSTTDGKTLSWELPVVASPNRPAQAFHDKPWLAVDTTETARRGNVYVAWTEVAPGTGCPGAPQFSCAILFSRSTDGGKSFSDPIKLSVNSLEPDPLWRTTDSGFEDPGHGAQVAVGPGGEVYVSWVGFGSTSLFFTRSLDGGQTFSPPLRIAHTWAIGHDTAGCQPRPAEAPFERVLNGDIRVRNWLSMAVDASPASPFRGRIYIAVPTDDFEPDATPRDESDVAFIYSKDGGLSWHNVDTSAEGSDFLNARVLLHEDDHRTDQFHPQVAVDSLGRVAVAWYDRRVSTPDHPNWQMSVFGRVSEDGGETFGALSQIGDVAFPPSRTNPNTGGFSGCYMGDYIGMTGGQSDFLVGWGDNRDGPAADPDPNVYFDRAMECECVDLSIAQTDSPDPVRPGQRLTFSIVVTNRGPAGATNVVVTDRLPANLTLVSASASTGTCGQDGGVVTCAIGSLAKGASATITLSTQPSCRTETVNVASVRSSERDLDPANNAAATSTVVKGRPC